MGAHFLSPWIVADHLLTQPPQLLDLVTGWNEAGLKLDISELAGQMTLDRMWQVVSARQTGQ